MVGTHLPQGPKAARVLTSNTLTARDSGEGLEPRREKSRFSTALPSFSSKTTASRGSPGSEEATAAAAAASAASRSLRASSMRLCRRPMNRGDCGDSGVRDHCSFLWVQAGCSVGRCVQVLMEGAELA